MSDPRDEKSSRWCDVVELRIPSSSAYVGVARQAVESIARRMRFERAEVEDVKLAVGEACNNAVRHGPSQNNESPVTVRCIVNHDSLAIEIHNCHDANLPQPTTDSPLNIDKEGGLGFYLMRQLMDNVDFEWGEDFALVRLVKNVPSRDDK
jgi:serine/threonine-protein kinase RsbW